VKSFYLMSSVIVIGALAACSYTSAQVAPLANAERPGAARYAARGHGWILPGAKKMELLYVSDNTGGQLLIFSFPKAELVGGVTLPSGGPVGLCSDSAGDVFVPTLGTYSQSNVYEYAHGGTQPVETLMDPGEAIGCAVDPKTGNLAVTNYLSTGGSQPHYGDVAIFEGAQGTPTTYFDSQITNYLGCAYDDSGDLFVDGSDAPATVGELPYGAGEFRNVTLTENIGPYSMQWYRSALVASGVTQSKIGPQPIYQIRISGSSGIVSGPTLLRSAHNLNPFRYVQFWSEGKTIVGPDRGRTGVAWTDLLNFWRSTGGSPKESVRRPNGALNLWGVTLSAAASLSALDVHIKQLDSSEAASR
jgi:hypothetical protein